MNDHSLREALHDAPAIPLDAKFADELEARLRDAAAAAPIVEMVPRRRGSRRTMVAVVALAALIAVAVAIALTRPRHHAPPAAPPGRVLGYQAHGNWYTHGKNTSIDDAIVDATSGARLLFHPNVPNSETLYTGGHAYTRVSQWVAQHGWPDAAHLARFRGKDWIEQDSGGSTDLRVLLVDLPIDWQRDRLAQSPRVRRVGSAMLAKSRTTKYEVDRLPSTRPSPLLVWVDEAGRVVRATVGPADNPAAVFFYVGYNDVAPVPLPDPSTVVSDKPTPLLTTGYRYTRTYHIAAVDGTGVDTDVRVDGVVDAEHLNAHVTSTETDYGRPKLPGQQAPVLRTRHFDEVYVDGVHYENGQRKLAPYGFGGIGTQTSFSIDALVDDSPFMGTFDVIAGLRRAGLKVQTERPLVAIGRVSTAHYWAEQTITSRFDTSGNVGTQRRFDIWVDSKGRVVELRIHQVSGKDRCCHQQDSNDVFMFSDYDTRPAITRP